MGDKNTTKYGIKVNWEFSRLASDEQIERARRSLEENGIRVLIAQHGEEAEQMVFDLLPEGAEVFTASTQTQRAITRAWAKFRNYRNTHHIAAKDKKTRDRLKAAGFVTTEKGAFIDKPRDADGKPIKGSRLRVLKSGIVVEKTGQRTTHIIGIPAKDRKRFANDPCGYMAELHPRWSKKLKQKGVVAALQWGAFASTKPMRSEDDICKSIFNYLHDTEGELRKERLHNLNGLRIVEHAEKPKRRKKKKAESSKRRGTRRRN